MPTSLQPKVVISLFKNRTSIDILIVGTLPTPQEEGGGETF